VSKRRPDKLPNPGESEREKSMHSIFLRPQYSHAELQKIVLDSRLLEYIVDKSKTENFVCQLLLPNLSAAALNYRLALLNAAELTGHQWSTRFARLAANASGLKSLVDEIEHQSPHSELSDALRDAARRRREPTLPGSLAEAIEDRLGTSPTSIRPASEIHDLRFHWIREALEILIEAANLAERKWAGVGTLRPRNRHREEPETSLFVFLYNVYFEITERSGLSSGGPFYRFASACVDLLKNEFPDLVMPAANSFRSLVMVALKRQRQQKPVKT
jgi:hypothetical protein